MTQSRLSHTVERLLSVTMLSGSSMKERLHSHIHTYIWDRIIDRDIGQPRVFFIIINYLENASSASSLAATHEVYKKSHMVKDT